MGGVQALEPCSTRPRTSPGETPIRIKEEVITLRKKTRLCAQKLHWRLKKQGLAVPVRTIGKILKDEGLVRKYRPVKLKYRYLKAALKPGELLEIDVKHVPGKVGGRPYFQYTAIDCASRWRYLGIYDQETSDHSVLFLKAVLARFPYPVTAVKTDNHATFTNRYFGAYKRSDRSSRELHALDRFCAEQGIAHYLIDPGKPAQNGTVERSHRSDNERLYRGAVFRSVNDLRKQVAKWNTEYNDLEHCGLGGKTPNEFLADYQRVAPPNVLA